MGRTDGKMTATAIEKYTIHDIDAPRVITSETQYDKYASVLHDLVFTKNNHSEQERQFIELLTALIEKYDHEHNDIENATPTQVLLTLMEANNLRQRDLVPFIGTESMVSMIIAGKRKLNVSQIDKLSKRFNVSAGVFFSI
jgi:HTH-type transcriptional regulator/antitoxin HigA